MTLTFEDRLSDSPFVEKVWRSRSDRGGPFVSIAQSHFEMAVTRHQGRTFITLRGPETQATRADCPPDGEWLCAIETNGPPRSLWERQIFSTSGESERRSSKSSVMLIRRSSGL